MQVKKKTKKGRVIYLVAASLIVVGTVVAILQSINQISILTIESSPYLTPFIGLLSLLFLIKQPDRRIVEHDVLRYINKMKENLSEINVQIASILLYVSPWESSPVNASTIENSFLTELERTLKSSEMKEQIDNYKQAVWLILLTPFSFISMVVFLPADWWIMGLLGFFVGTALAFLLLRENPETMSRIIYYSFARWFFETASLDLSRRKAGVRMEAKHKDRIAASLELSKPVIDLAKRNDWRGFDQNSGNLENLVGIPGYDRLTWNVVKRYLEFLDWCVKRIYTQHSLHIDIFLKNGRKQVNSAINVLRTYREDSFNEEEEKIALMLQVLTSYAKDKETLRSFSVEFYEKLDKLSLTELGGYFEILGLFPLNLKQSAQSVQSELPKPSSDINGIDRLSWFVVSSAELGFLDLPRSLSVIARWGTKPTTVLKAIGPLATKVLLERNVGFSIEQLRTVARALGRRILIDDNTDPSKVLKHLEELKKNNPQELVRQYALELQVDTKRSQNSTINTGMEAITRFIDEFYKAQE
ncbi:MAG: hypothetical protein ACTSRU_15985 [Candidatus Hodarchaeales archaeon]